MLPILVGLGWPHPSPSGLADARMYKERAPPATCPSFFVGSPRNPCERPTRRAPHPLLFTPGSPPSPNLPWWLEGPPTKTHPARPPGSPMPACTRSGPRRPHALVFLWGALGIRANAPQGVPPTPCSSRPALPPPPIFLGGWRGPRPKRTRLALRARRCPHVQGAGPAGHMP